MESVPLSYARKTKSVSMILLVRSGELKGVGHPSREDRSPMTEIEECAGDVLKGDQGLPKRISYLVMFMDLSQDPDHEHSNHTRVQTYRYGLCITYNIRNSAATLDFHLWIPWHASNP